MLPFFPLFDKKRLLVMKTLRSVIALAALGALGSHAWAITVVPQGPITVVNPLSGVAITVDGQFTPQGTTPGVTPGTPPTLPAGGEWSDITPLAFISPPTPSGPLQSVPLNDPSANSLLYAGLAPGTSVATAELYLMYDYLPRTNPTFSPGEFVADIAFPLTIGTDKFPNAVVRVRGHIPIPPIPAVTGITSVLPSSPVDFMVDLDGGLSSTSDPLAATFGIDGAVGFGPSTLSLTDHLLIELEVPLNIPAGFGGIFPPGGTRGSGVYSPEPAFWGNNAANDGIDPPASGAIFVIDPNGVTHITASVPEVGTGIIAGMSLAGVFGYQAWRRTRRG